MKILILALPRAGSKFVQLNCQRWLQALGLSPLIHPRAPLVGFGELLNCELNDQQGQLSVTNNQQLTLDRSLPNRHNEFEIRANIFAAGPSVVAKYMCYHNDIPREIERTVRLAHSADITYILERNSEDQLSSCMISHYFGIWTPGNAQRQRITQAVDSGEKIPRNDILEQNIRQQQQCFGQVVDAVRQQASTLSIDFSTITSSVTSKEFCQHMQLPHCEFDFESRTVEYAPHRNQLTGNVQ